MSGPVGLGEAVAAALGVHGLVPRGIVNFEDGDGPPLHDGSPAGSVMLVGHGGSSFWDAFSRWHARPGNIDQSDPLDRWSKAIIKPLVEQFGVTAYFPSDPPYQPFQTWAKTAEGLTASPLGFLIHPQYGLWHGYRAALGFAERLAATKAEWNDPCGPCVEKPCMTACPAGAVSSGPFAVSACRTYLISTEGGSGCLAKGCMARDACPVGQGYRYRQEQVRFHMAALHLPMSK